MKKYMAIKNAMITSLLAVMYYKAVFADCSEFIRIFGTLTISVALMGLLKSADDCYLKETKRYGGARWNIKQS